MHRRLATVVLGALTSLTTLAFADTVCLKDGRILEDVKIERGENGVTIHYEHGNIFVPDELILTVIKEGAEESFTPRTEKEKAMFAKGKVPWKDKWVSTKTFKKLITRELKKRKEKVEEMKELQHWRNRYKEKSKHFSFESNVPPEVFEEYRDLMEAYFKAFSKEWKIKAPTGSDRLLVCFYSNRKQFMRTGGAGSGTLGYFKFVKPLELNIYWDRLDPVLTEGVMYHEANHYLQKLINPSFSYPHFPGESIAEYYGASRYDPKSKKLETGLLQEGRLVQIQTDFDSGKPLKLQEMVSTDQMFEHYTWGWSLAHFLMNNSKYAKKFQKFVLELALGEGIRREPMSMDGLSTVRGAEVWEQFKKYLGLRGQSDIDDLEKEWHEYVKGLLTNITARGKEKAAFAAASSYPRRPIRARRLFEEAISEGCKNPLAFHRYSELLMEKGEHDKAIEMLDKAIAIDPVVAEFYAKKAEVLELKNEKDEARRLAQLALELEPDNVELRWDLEDLLKE